MVTLLLSGTERIGRRMHGCIRSLFDVSRYPMQVFVSLGVLWIIRTSASSGRSRMEVIITQKDWQASPAHSLSATASPSDPHSAQLSGGLFSTSTAEYCLVREFSCWSIRQENIHVNASLNSRNHHYGYVRHSDAMLAFMQVLLSNAVSYSGRLTASASSRRKYLYSSELVSSNGLIQYVASTRSIR